MSVDQLLDDIADMTGGEVRKEQNPDNFGKQFFRNKQVQRGGKIAKIGG